MYDLVPNLFLCPCSSCVSHPSSRRIRKEARILPENVAGIPSSCRKARARRRINSGELHGGMELRTGQRSILLLFNRRIEATQPKGAADVGRRPKARDQINFERWLWLGAGIDCCTGSHWKSGSVRDRRQFRCVAEWKPFQEPFRY